MKILLWLEARLGPECVDACTWDAVYGLLPDQAADFHEQIRGETSCEDVRKMFGISPLMLTCWACYMRKSPPRSGPGARPPASDCHESCGRTEGK